MKRIRRKTPRPRGHMTITDLAAYLNVTTTTIKRWVKSGAIPRPEAQHEQLKLWTPEQVQVILNWRTGKQ